MHLAAIALGGTGVAPVPGMLWCPLLLALAAQAAPAPRVIEMTAARFQFEPEVIEVEQGEAVSLRVRSLDGTHGLEIKAYGVKLKIPKGGETVQVDLVADKAGTFPFACSEYCGSGHRGMRGKLVVKPRAR